MLYEAIVYGAIAIGGESEIKRMVLYETVGLKLPREIQDIPLPLSSIKWGSRILHFQLTILENGRFIH